MTNPVPDFARILDDLELPHPGSLPLSSEKLSRRYAEFCRRLRYDETKTVVLYPESVDEPLADGELFGALFRPGPRDLGRLRSRTRDSYRARWYQLERPDEPKEYLSALREVLHSIREESPRRFLEEAAAFTASDDYRVLAGQYTQAPTLERLTSWYSGMPGSDWLSELELRQNSSRWAGVWYYADSTLDEIYAIPVLLGFATLDELYRSVGTLFSIPSVGELYGAQVDAVIKGDAHLADCWVYNPLLESPNQCQALREHLQYALYPELAADLDAVQKAIAACAEGAPESSIPLSGGSMERAATIVVVLGLERFVNARIRAIDSGSTESSFE